MKILHTLPKLDKTDFFERYANLTPTLFWLGVFAQIVSFATELGIVYNIVNSKLLDLPIPIHPDKVTVISWMAAILGAGFFEIGLRKFIPYAVRSFLYNRWKGLDKAMSIFILVVALLLVGGSISLSYKGSKELVNTVTTPKPISNDPADIAYQSQRQEIWNQYRADSTNTASTYNQQIAAIEKKYRGKIEKQKSEIALYNRKEIRTGRSYQSRKQSHRGNISKYESALGEELAAIQSEKREAMTAISATKQNALSAADQKHQNALSKIETQNHQASTKAASKAALYGGGLAWFTVLCMAVFILSVIIGEIHKKGSGIVEQVLVTQYDFSPSAWSRLCTMLKEKVQEKVHNKITKWERTTPPPQLPVLHHELFDIGKIEQERIQIEVEKKSNKKIVIPSKFKNGKIIKSPNSDPFDYTDFSKNQTKTDLTNQQTNAMAPKSTTSTSTAKIVELNTTEPSELSDDRIVIKGFNYNQKTPDNSLSDRTDSKGVYTMSLDDLPSEEKMDSKQVVEKVVEKIVYINNLPTKNCIRCGKEFTYKSKKKKYCSTRCRQDRWESDNGKELKQGRVRNLENKKK